MLLTGEIFVPDPGLIPPELPARPVLWSSTERQLSKAREIPYPALPVFAINGPDVNAALVCVGEEDDDGGNDDNGCGDDDAVFQVVFSCSDSCDDDPTISAVLVVDGTEIPVTNGQKVELELDDEVEVAEDDGILQVQGPSFELVVTCEDESGNVGTATATPEFGDEEEEAEEDD